MPTDSEPRAGITPLGFLVRFGLAFAVLEALVYGLLWRESWFAPYARLNASATALLFGPFVEGLRAVDGYLTMPGDSIIVRPGCDSYQASAVLLAGIVAFPAPALRRVVGALVGLALLGVLNVVRLGVIVLVRLHRPELFDRMHVEILPGLFVLAALLLWLGWILWVRPRPSLS